MTCDILILSAMQAEAGFILDKMDFGLIDHDFSPLPTQCYQATYHNKKIILATHGQDPIHQYDYVGTQFAAVIAYVLIQAYQPRFIINAGTAGGFLQYGAKIGDVYINALGCLYHDRKISIPLYQHFQQRKIPSLIANEILQNHPNLQLKPGLISTGNSLDTSKEEIQHILQSGAQAKEMEAAAIAEIASLFQKEIIALKSITDFLDGGISSAEEFLQNLDIASKALANHVMQLVELLAAT